MTPLRVMSLVVRILAIAIVAVSPWLQPRKKPSSARSVVYVVDRSASIGHGGLEEANEYLSKAWPAADDGVRCGVIAFDGRAEVVAPVGTARAPVVGDGSEPGASDLAGAMRLALGALPSEGHRTIVLLTDARPTRGDASSEARRAAEMGVRVDVVPIAGEVPAVPTLTALKPRASHVA